MDPVNRDASSDKDHLAKVYAKAWLDDDFRHRLEADPAGALRELALENGVDAVALTGGDLQEVLKGNVAHLHPPPACC